MVLAVLAGCSPTAQRRAGYATMAVALAAAACDWGQTRTAASDGWKYGYEQNPILGTNPHPGTVDAYMTIAVAGTALIGQMLPERYRWMFYTPIAVAEIQLIATNNTRPVCGLGTAPPAPEPTWAVRVQH